MAVDDVTQAGSDKGVQNAKFSREEEGREGKRNPKSHTLTTAQHFWAALSKPKHKRRAANYQS